MTKEDVTDITWLKRNGQMLGLFILGTAAFLTQWNNIRTYGPRISSIESSMAIDDVREGRDALMIQHIYDELEDIKISQAELMTIVLAL